MSRRTTPQRVCGPSGAGTGVSSGGVIGRDSRTSLGPGDSAAGRGGPRRWRLVGPRHRQVVAPAPPRIVTVAAAPPPLRVTRAAAQHGAMSAHRTTVLVALAALAVSIVGLQACHARAHDGSDVRPAGRQPASSPPATGAAASLAPPADDGRLEAARMLRLFCRFVDSGRLARAGSLLAPHAWPRRELRAFAGLPLHLGARLRGARRAHARDAHPHPRPHAGAESAAGRRRDTVLHPGEGRDHGELADHSRALQPVTLRKGSP